MSGNHAITNNEAGAKGKERSSTPIADVPADSKDHLPKRSKKAKRKTALTPAELEMVRVTPVPKRSAVLAELPEKMQWSSVDKAAQVQLDESRMSATFHKGYRMVRATHGAHTGTWYFEVNIDHLGTSGHCRLGWCTNKGELQGPVGYDEHSYAYRDLEGVKVHKALRQQYAEPFREGDVIGCYLHMPDGGRPFERQRSDIVTWKGDLYFMEGDAQIPQPLEGSVIAFSCNGVPQGPAYRNVTEGRYYPAVSMYTLPDQGEGASVTANFGPKFRYDPVTVEGCPSARPACELSSLAHPGPDVPSTGAEEAQPDKGGAANGNVAVTASEPASDDMPEDKPEPQALPAPAS